MNALIAIIELPLEFSVLVMAMSSYFVPTENPLLCAVLFSFFQTECLSVRCCSTRAID